MIRSVFAIMFTTVAAVSAVSAASADFYCVYFYTGDTLLRTLYMHDFDAVSTACQEWWNSDPRNVCRWVQI